MKYLENIGIVFDKNGKINQALTHSSYANENNIESYERLEYLGDAVLELVVSDYLFNNNNSDEGKLSKLRSTYVCENALYEYSLEIELEKYIKVGKGISKPNKTVIADVFESVIAVIYLEMGIEKVIYLFNELIKPIIKSKEDFLHDYKSLLQELVQTDKVSVNYKLVCEKGPSHDKTFIMEVMINNILYGTGQGKSKKEAEQNAAKEAYYKQAK